MHKNLCLAGMLPFFIVACASDLVVSDGVSAMKGIPVGSPMLFEIETTTTFNALPSLPTECPPEFYCATQVESTAQFLPLGKIYYVNFESATLAKSEFGLTFADSGVLTGVSLNSTPSVESFSGLLETVLPFIRAPQAAAAGGPALAPPGITAGACPLTPAEAMEKHCVKASTNVTRVREIDIEYQ